MSEVVTGSGGSGSGGFEARMLSGAQKLGQTWEAIKELLNKGTFIFSNEGLFLSSFDNNHVSLVNLMIKRSAFQRYVCCQKYIVALNLQTLYKAFKMCSKQTQVTLRIKRNDPRIVYLDMANPQSGMQTKITMYSGDVDRRILEFNERTFNRHVRMLSTKFQVMIGFLSHFTSEETDNKSLLVQMFEDTLEFQTGTGEQTQSRIILQQSNDTGMLMETGTVDAFSDDFAGVTDEMLNDEDAESDDEEEEEEEEADSEEEEEEKRGKKRKQTAGKKGAPAAKKARKTTTTTVTKKENNRRESDDEDEEERERKPIFEIKLLLKYVKYFTKATPLCQVMRMFLQKGSPAIFSFNVGTLGVLHFCLSPIEADSVGQIEGDDGEEEEEDAD